MVRSDITRRAFFFAAALVAAGLAGCRDGRNLDGSTATEGGSRVTLPRAKMHGSKTARAKRSDIDGILDRMTLDQKVAQLFVVTPEVLTGMGQVTAAGDATRDALKRHPVGGLCYFGQNITGADQLRRLLADTRSLCAEAGAGLAPFLTVDEEGGPLVARVANSGYFDVQRFPDMAEVGATGDASQAANVGRVVGAYLSDIGFNVDFAPVADVLTNPANQVIGARAFSSDVSVVSQMVAAEVPALLENGVLPCLKHFPGHGDTEGDSHTGAVCSMRGRDQIEACELAPFRAGIEAGCPLVMVGHIETPNFAADGLPASLSKTMMTDVLRGELGFDGVIVSDSFSMGAITQNYEPADAALRFIQAGGDLILMTPDLEAAHQGLMDAIDDGTLTEARVDESVKRVLKAKQKAGLLG